VNTEPAVFRTASADETRALAAAFGRVAAVGDVLLLEGPLGAGKTVFVQGLAAGLGVAAAVRSPTFVLVTEYAGRVPLVHVDLYRIEHARGLDGLGLEEREDDAVLAVEWGERLLDRIADGVHARFEEEAGGGRRIALTALGERGRAWLSREAAARAPAGR
jgi:tRNA threonylcarbamoyladenosine biosynthesis protein TsaE